MGQPVAASVPPGQAMSVPVQLGGKTAGHKGVAAATAVKLAISSSSILFSVYN